MVYEKASDVLTILERAVTHIAPNDGGTGGAEITAGRASFTRMEHIVEFGNGVHVTRTGQDIAAGTAVVYLSPDDKRITTLELHGNASVALTPATAGGLQGFSGRDVTIEYGGDGQGIERALLNGTAVVSLSSGGGKAGREIAANALDLHLAADGATPKVLEARGAVRLVLPAEQSVAMRTVKSDVLSGSGDPDDPGRGLSRARFGGHVEYREQNGSAERSATAQQLDVSLKAAMAAFDSAVFTGAARFVDAKVSGTAAVVAYAVDAGSIALSGSETASPRPHVSNDQIVVDASTIDVTLAGPVLAAKGEVKSVLQPPQSGRSDARLPSMLKQDQPVNITADTLAFDGEANQARYDGKALLWQSDTSIRADRIVLDSKTGGIDASGSVLTTTSLDQTDKEKKKKDRVRSMASAKRFIYDDSRRRASYSGDVHFSQAENDLAASTVDLFLKPGGNELERAEAADAGGKLVLREQGRRTSGSRLTY